MTIDIVNISEEEFNQINSAKATGTSFVASKPDRESGKFSPSFTEISALIGETGAKVDNFRKDILAYAKDRGMAIEDINRVVYAALDIGIDYEDVLEHFDGTEKLSVDGYP